MCKHLLIKLSARLELLVALDNINDYYDQNLKKLRLSELGVNINNESHKSLFQSTKYSQLLFIKQDLLDRDNVQSFSQYNFDYIVHFAAQPGVRNSIENPRFYMNNNINGFLNLLEYCKNHKPKHLLFASSSTIYGKVKPPFREDRLGDALLSPYAISKKSKELLASMYSD